MIFKTPRKRFSGVPPGYSIPGWTYRGVWKEHKYAPGKWKINFTATKQRKAKGYGNIGKGSRIHWKIIADQYVTKIAPGKYQTHMIGKKYHVQSKIKKNRW